MHATLQSLSTHLRQLETDIILGVLHTTASREEAGEILKSQRVILESHNERLVSSCARQLLASNDSRAGVILWLKPGQSLAIDPKPIHLEDTLSYFIRNHHYCSTGYHVFDICTLDEDTQYKRIMEFIRLSGNPKVIDAQKEFEQLELVNSMAQRYCKGTLEDTEVINDGKCNGDPVKKDSTLVKLMKEIISTAKHVFADIKAGAIATPDTNKFNFDRLALSKSEVIFYYWRLSVAGLFYIMLQNFRAELRGPHDDSMDFLLMPARRPSSSNDGVQLDLTGQRQARVEEYTKKISSMMQRGADYVNPGEEPVSRDGNVLSSAPGPSETLPCQATKRKFAGDCASDRALLKNVNKEELKAIIKKHRTTVPGGLSKLTKDKMIAHIITNTNYDK